MTEQKSLVLSALAALAIVAAVTAGHGPAIVDVVFTGIEEFAAPTTGFRPVAGEPETLLAEMHP